MHKGTKEQQKVIPIICMPTSLNLLRLVRVFPRKNSELNPGATFYLKFFGMWLFSLLPWVSSVLHFFNTVTSKEYNHIELDLNYAISLSASFALIWAFILKVKSAAQMFTFLSDFEEFGKPTNFDKENEKFSKYAKMHLVYLEAMIWFAIGTSNIFKKESCRRENLIYNLREVCGLFTYTWLPFNIDYFPVREIYTLIQIFGVHYFYMLAALMSWQIFETIHHIILKMRHVKNAFIDALTQQDPIERRLRFNSAVKYHNAVLGLEVKLNDVFSIFMFTHMVLTGAILGSGIYSFYNAKNVSNFLVCIGWFWGLFMDCFSGQRLQDESSHLVFAIYDSPWYKCEIPLRRDILLVLQRCQISMKLRASSFGIMNRAMFLGVLKVTYSYVTLLNNA